MSVYKIRSETIIQKPISEVYNFITTVANWTGIHPATKDILGPSGINSTAVPGLKFVEVVEARGLNFNCEWEVRKVVKNEFFEIIFPADFTHGPLNEIVITYNLTAAGDNATKFVRTMVNFCKPDAKEEETRDLEEPGMHDNYLKAVKARLEG